jgi:hypothetical protein
MGIPTVDNKGAMRGGNSLETSVNVSTCPDCAVARENAAFCQQCGKPLRIPLAQRAKLTDLRITLTGALVDPTNSWFLFLGALFAFIGIALFAEGARIYLATQNQLLLGAIVAPATFFFLRGVAAWRRGGLRQLRSDPRAPIAYFRSFRTDDHPNLLRMFAELFLRIIAGRDPGGTSIEASIAIAARRAGPFIALSDPFQKWPNLGAARIKVGGISWQPVVRLLLAHSQAIVFHFVDFEVTDAMLWEWREALKYLPKHRIFVFATKRPKRRPDFEWRPMSILSQQIQIRQRSASSGN